MLRGMLVTTVLMTTASLCCAEPPDWLDENTLGFAVADRTIFSVGVDQSSDAYEKMMGAKEPPKGAELFVERVFPHGQADGKLMSREIMLMPRAIIVTANGKPVKTPEDWKKLLATLKPGDNVKLNVKPVVARGDGLAWGNPVAMTLPVSTKRDLARKAVTIKSDEVLGSKTASFKDGSKVGTESGPLRMSFSIGADGKATRPTLYIVHAGKDWVFVENVMVRSGDDLEIIKLKDIATDPIRKVAKDGVVEVRSVPMNGNVQDAAILMGSKGKVIVRLSGSENSVDHTITEGQKLAIWAMMNAYEAFDGEWPE